MAYGWSLGEINELPVNMLLEFHKQAGIKEARDRLVMLNIVQYPKMTKEGRNKFFNSLRDKAYPDRLKNGISFGEFARKQKNGIGKSNN